MKILCRQDKRWRTWVARMKSIWFALQRWAQCNFEKVPLKLLRMLSSTTSSSNKHAHQIEQSLFQWEELKLELPLSWAHVDGNGGRSKCKDIYPIITLEEQWKESVEHLAVNEKSKSMEEHRNKLGKPVKKKNRPFLGFISLCEDLCVNRRDPIGDERGAFFTLLGVFSLWDKWIDLLLRWETTREKCSVKSCASWVQHMEIDGKRYTRCSCLAGALIDSLFMMSGRCPDRLVVHVWQVPWSTRSSSIDALHSLLMSLTGTSSVLLIVLCLFPCSSSLLSSDRIADKRLSDWSRESF